MHRHRVSFAKKAVARLRTSTSSRRRRFSRRNAAGSSLSLVVRPLSVKPEQARSPGYTMARYGHARKDRARDRPPPERADSACHPWSDQEIRSAFGHVVGHATAGETEKPQVNWGLCWCPRGDLNPHAR
ncbi:hypothetical protein RVR_10504 [Actinacidiphila reveromycinica]|uniref:Uncharacterized protein n=1 Tax=Actinacidiphila reveromycinica TaxID=659352 RepID=A0A7U3VM41_9ACTN|nr:hypothetical protein RVR_10504 [Streptomyces sp. SN-593]